MSKKSIQDQLAAINKIMNKPEEIPFYRFNFGRYNGRTLEYVFQRDKSYLSWLYNNCEDLNPVLEEFIQERCLS